MNFIVPFDTLSGVVYDPVNNLDDRTPARTYIYFRKYIADMVTQQRTSWVNWILFRYADILLTYAEAKNEATGPDDSVYDAIDQIRRRAGMPVLDRRKYNSKDKLREAIRNERRVELAGEGLRYFDIQRWKTAEIVLNKQVVSFEIPSLLPLRIIHTRNFDPAKHYVWPIPQSAIDKAKNLEQHSEWR
ncbi:MAG: RagB/SusD family nutrient uptake outer membrane protein [Draconibacterium sp.]